MAVLTNRVEIRQYLAWKLHHSKSRPACMALQDVAVALFSKPIPDEEIKSQSKMPQFLVDQGVIEAVVVSTEDDDNDDSTEDR